MKISILFLFGLITNVFAGVWVPSAGQSSTEGKIVFNLPFPDMATPLIREGFFSIPGGTPFDFKRTMAVSGQESVSPLVEISPDLFLPAENPSGYLVLEDSKKVLKDVNRNDPGFFAKRFASNLKEIQSLPVIEEIPSKIEDFGKWGPGDSIAFSKILDLRVNVAYGTKTFFNYGVVGRISGNWDILIRLPSVLENPEKKLLVLVSYSIPEGFNFNLDKGGFTENVNLFKLWGKSQTFTFLFELSNPNTAPPFEIVRFEGGQKIQEAVINANALLAYQEVLKGNLVIANLLSQMKNYGVRKIFEEEEEARIKEGNKGEGFKIRWDVDPNFSKGNTFIVGQTKTLRGNLVLENLSVHFTQDLKQNQSDSKNKTFVGFLQQIENIGKSRGSSNRRYASSFKFQLTLNNINRERYLQAIKGSLFKIGFSDDSLIPNPLKDKIGNLDLNLDINLSNSALDVLMDLPDEYPENVFVSQANEYVSEFFQNETSINHEVCENYGETNLNKCIFISKKKTFEAMTNGYRALKIMKMKRNERNYFEFLKSFGEFGKAFIENKFSVVTFLKFISFHYQSSLQGMEKFGGRRMITLYGRPTPIPYEIRVQIKGQNIKPYSKVLRNSFRDPNK